MSVNGIKITDVIVFPVKTEGSKTKAFAKVVMNDQFIISGIRVIDGKNGPFIAFPQEKGKTEDKYYDICFPTTAEMRSYVSQQVLDQYSMTLEINKEA